MRRIRETVIVLMLSMGVLATSGCTIDDAVITCDNIDDYLYFCYTGCVAAWDCEEYYNSLDIDTQLALDQCADCLLEEADLGTCGDCIAPGGESCQDLVTTYLYIDCWVVAPCDDIGEYLNICYGECTPTWDCADSYNSLDISTQNAVDQCASCLLLDADLGSCNDCLDPGGGSCQALLETAFGVDCFTP